VVSANQCYLNVMERSSEIDFNEDEEALINVAFAKNEEDVQNQEAWLVGRLHTRNPVNMRVFKSTITQIWKVKHVFKVYDLDQNLFTFHFFQRKDHDLVLRESPWNFDRNLIVLDELLLDTNPRDVILSHARFWVRMHELHLNMRNEGVAKSITGELGAYIECDARDEYRLGKFIRIRVRMDVTKPLKRGT